MPGELNAADHLTKGKAWHETEKLVRKVGRGGTMAIADRTGNRRASRDQISAVVSRMASDGGGSGGAHNERSGFGHRLETVTEKKIDSVGLDGRL